MSNEGASTTAAVFTFKLNGVPVEFVTAEAYRAALAALQAEPPQTGVWITAEEDKQRRRDNEYARRYRWLVQEQDDSPSVHPTERAGEKPEAADGDDKAVRWPDGYWPREPDKPA